MSEWLFLPPWSMIAIAIGCVVLAVSAVIRTMHERKRLFVRRWPLLLLLRAAAIFLLLWIALNPTAITPKAMEGRPSLLVLLDSSASMATQDVDGQSRWLAAVDTLIDPDVRSELEDHFELKIMSFDNDRLAVDANGLSHANASGRASDLSSALTESIIDQADNSAQAGVLLISDGRSTNPGALDAARLGLARAVPLWTWCLGGDVPRRDLWVETPSTVTLAFSDSEVQIGATIHQIGFEHSTFNVQLLRDDEVVDTFEVIPDEAGVHISTTVTAPKEGEQRYSFRVVGASGEADTQNNQRSVYVRSVGDKVRIFLAEGQPHWDTKFLVQSLKRNDRIALTAVYRMGPDRQFAVFSEGEQQRREEGDYFPRTLDAWSAYDVVIMGRGCEAFFDDDTEQMLTEYVSRRGGGLIFNRGKSYSGRFRSLAKFEPVVWSNQTTPLVTLATNTVPKTGPLVELSSDGNLDALMERLPTFDQTRQTTGVKPLAVVMAGGKPIQSIDADQLNDDDHLVLLAYQLYGRGRVLTVNASGLWRWAFREQGEPEDEFIYDRLWGSLIRWIISGSDFLAGHQTALRSAQRSYTDQQPVRFMISTREIDPQTYQPLLTIEGGDEQLKLQPRRESADGLQTSWLAEAGPLKPGTYEVKLTNNIGTPESLTTTIEVISGSIEDRQLSADPQLMQELADISEGRVLKASELANFSDIYKQWRAEQQLADDKQPMWDRWWLFAIILVLLGSEWYLRRQENLL